MQKVIIYTDGACSGNPGPGGWAAILISGDLKKEISNIIKMLPEEKLKMLYIIGKNI